MSVLDEITTCTKVISQIQDYHNKNWAIGLNGDTLAPDGFLKFFAERQLPFAYYVRSVTTDISIGEPTAYQANTDTIKNYVQGLVAKETAAVNGTISELTSYKNNFWAIGLNGDTLQPDGFLAFFDVRDLPFAYFVRSKGHSLGEQSAYDQNVATLQGYLKKVSQMMG